MRTNDPMPWRMAPTPEQLQAPDATQLVGDSPQTQKLRQQIRQASQHPLSVLILGETGTGQEVVA